MGELSAVSHQRSAVSRRLSAIAGVTTLAMCGCLAGMKANAVGQAAVRASNTRIEARDITVQGDFVTPRILAVGLASVVPLGGAFYWLVIRPVVRPHRVLRNRGIKGMNAAEG